MTKVVPLYINDDSVYLSPWLEKTFPEFYQRLTDLFRRLYISWYNLPHTNDIWCRDFMPLVVDGLLVQYRYSPDYLLQKPSQRQYITDGAQVCTELQLPFVTTNLILDGGNMVRVGQYLIMTEKIFHENPDRTPAQIIAEIEQITHLTVLLLPWDRAEKYGHADGIVRPIGDNAVLMTNYADYDRHIADEIYRRLSQHFRVVTLRYDVPHPDTRNWVYINYLEAGNTLIVPALGIPEDRQAIAQLKSIFRYKRIESIRMEEVVNLGGALNCITWTLNRQTMRNLLLKHSAGSSAP